MLLQKSALPNPGSRYGPDEEGFFGTEQNRAVKGAVFNFSAITKKLSSLRTATLNKIDSVFQNLRSNPFPSRTPQPFQRSVSPMRPVPV